MRFFLLLLAWARCAALVASLADVSFAAQASPGQGAAALRAGETLTLELGPSDPPLEGRGGHARRIEVQKEGSALTVVLSSHDVDAFLRVEGTDGGVWAEDDDGGIETDARVVIPARGEPTCIVVVVAKKGAGQLHLSLHGGDVPPLSGVAESDAAIVWRAAAAERARSRGDREAEGRHLLELGNRHAFRAQLPEARRAFEQSLVIKRELEDLAGIAVATRNLANVLVSLGDHPGARELYEESLALARELADDHGLATTLGNLANVYNALGDYPRARELFAENLEFARAVGNGEEELRSLSNLGITLSSMGDFRGARRCFEEHLSIARERADPLAQAAASQNLGTLCYLTGDLVQARVLYEECLALAQSLGELQGIARAQASLGNIDLALGDMARALERYEAYLTASIELGDRAGQLRALSNMGSVLAQTGRLAQALEHFEESLTLSLELGDREGETTALANMSTALCSLADLPRALELGERAMERLIAMGDRPGQQVVLGGLGNIHLGLGNVARALELQQQRLSMAREFGDRDGEAAALGDLGDAQLSSGRVDEAQGLFEQQLTLARQIGDIQKEAEALGSLGGVARVRGEPRLALELAQQADTLVGETGSRAYRVGLALLSAQAALALDDAQTAEAELVRAEGELDELTAEGLDAEQASGLRGTFAELDAVAHDLTWLRLAAAPDEEARSTILQRGFASAGRWKSRALLEGIVAHRAGARSAEFLDAARRHRQTLEAHITLLEEIADAIHAEKPRTEIESLRTRAAEALASARTLATALRGGVAGTTTSELPLGASATEVRQDVLGSGELLIEYAAGEERLYAYVLGAERLEFLELGAHSALTADLERFLAAIRDPLRAAGPSEVASLGRSLFERLLAPALALATEPPTRLLIVPNAALAALPFEALVCASASASPTRWDELTFVLDRFAVSYGPSTSVLLELAHTPPRGSTGTVLLLADPLYSELSVDSGVEASSAGETSGAGASRGRPALAGLPRLPGTRRETLAIASLLTNESDALAELMSRRSGSLVAERLSFHLGAEATRARLEGNLRAHAVLHLACHGHVDAEFPARTGLALSAAGGKDGWFTLEDALQLDLDCDLVVLSACQTAQGKTRAGEGVESLARAFLYSGARAVIASAWLVDDRAAANVMEAFYRTWLGGGLAPADALRRAKLALRRGEVELGTLRGIGVGADAPPPSALEPGHPFYWAPFLHVGLGAGRENR